MAEAQTVAAGLTDHAKAVGVHAKNLAGATVDAAKAGYAKADQVARAGVEKGIEQGGLAKAAIKENGFWKTVATGARNKPLIAGAAVIGTAIIAKEVIAGPRQQKVVMDRQNQSELGR